MQSPHRPLRAGWIPPRLGRVAAALALAGGFAAAPASLQSQTPGRGIQSDREFPVLPIGSPLPAFDLPGIDGKNHRSSEYASSRLLAVVFESNHCPVSQLYEARIEKLHEEYGRKGVAFVAINPNNPKAVRLDELGYTDVTDSLPEMKLRAQARGISWPYLYDGDTQATSMKFGAVATPTSLHIRSRAQAALSGTDRRQPARRAREGARRAQRPRCAARPPSGSRPRNEDVRVHDQVAVEGVGRRAGMGPDSEGAGHRRHGRRRRTEADARESDGQSHARALLVDRLRRLHEGLLRPRDDVPDVSPAGVRPRHDQHRPAGTSLRPSWSSSGSSTHRARTSSSPPAIAQRCRRHGGRSGPSVRR